MIFGKDFFFCFNASYRAGNTVNYSVYINKIDKYVNNIFRFIIFVIKNNISEIIKIYQLQTIRICKDVNILWIVQTNIHIFAHFYLSHQLGGGFILKIALDLYVTDIDTACIYTWWRPKNYISKEWQ